MKILIINDFDTTKGGVENYIHELIKQESDIKFYFYGEKKEPKNPIKKYYNFESKGKIKKIIDEFKPDLIHIYNIGRVITPSFMKYSKSKKIPLIMSFRDYHYICPKSHMINDRDEIIESHNSAIECILHHYPKKNIVYDTARYYKILFHKIMINKFVDYFLTPSDHLTNWIKKQLRIPVGETLPNPTMILNDRKYSFKEREGVLFVGNISENKGIKTLINAFKIVIKKIPTEKLCIIGDGPLKEEIEKTISRNNLQNIQMTGKKNREELKKFYAISKITVIPSECIESFGNVVIESFAFKTPVIVSNLGTIKYNTMKSNGGLIFERKNHLDLAEKIIKLLEDEKLRKKLGQNGYKYSQTLTFKNHLKELEKIYLKCLRNRQILTKPNI